MTLLPRALRSPSSEGVSDRDLRFERAAVHWIKPMDEINVSVLVLRWLHIGAAIVAVGGAVFVRFALRPSVETVLDESARERLMEAIRRRWSKFVHGSVALLLLTGGANFVILAIPPKVEPVPYHWIFGVKFLAAMSVFLIASALVGKGPAFAAIRKRSASSLSLLLVLAALIVLLSGLLNQVRNTQSSSGATKNQPTVLSTE